jgi:hypothetical protein
MRLAHERHHVMGTDAVDWDGADNHHLVAGAKELNPKMRRWIFGISAEQLICPHGCNA